MWLLKPAPASNVILPKCICALPMVFPEVFFNELCVNDPYGNSPAKMTSAKCEKNALPCRTDSKSGMSHAQLSSCASSQGDSVFSVRTMESTPVSTLTPSVYDSSYPMRCYDWCCMGLWLEPSSQRVLRGSVRRCEGKMTSVGPPVTTSSGCKCFGPPCFKQREGGVLQHESSLIYRLGNLYGSPYC